MAQAPNHGFIFHARMMMVLGTLAALDVTLIHHAASSLLAFGPSTQLLFGFEVRSRGPLQCRRPAG